jgi:hypothetical protein
LLLDARAPLALDEHHLGGACGPLAGSRHAHEGMRPVRRALGSRNRDREGRRREEACESDDGADRTHQSRAVPHIAPMDQTKLSNTGC